MANQQDHIAPDCDCSTSPSSSEGIECSVCAPKMALTPEEESILSEMRAIKERVRPISDRLKDIEQAVKNTTDPDASERQSEWRALSNQLEDLRTHWKDWEERLQQAIERKLILLGHRDPPG